MGIRDICRENMWRLKIPWHKLRNQQKLEERLGFFLSACSFLGLRQDISVILSTFLVLRYYNHIFSPTLNVHSYSLSLPQYVSLSFCLCLSFSPSPPVFHSISLLSRTGWSWNHYIAEGDLEFMTLLPLPPNSRITGMCYKTQPVLSLDVCPLWGSHTSLILQQGGDSHSREGEWWVAFT